jgi:ATP-binding cassette subfamily B (MDR/TAP) protein 1
MPIYWFDYPENHSGTLASRLGTDCQSLNAMTTSYIYILIQSILTLIGALIIALIYEWRTALFAIGCMPLMVFFSAVKTKFRNDVD